MYVVTMYRFGKKQEYFETHSYTLGVFSTKEKAIFRANAEMLARAGKYNAYLEYCTVDGEQTNYDDDDFSCGWVEYTYSEEAQQEVERIYGKQWFV